MFSLISKAYINSAIFINIMIRKMWGSWLPFLCKNGGGKFTIHWDQHIIYIHTHYTIHNTYIIQYIIQY